MFKFNGNTYSLDQVEDAAKQSNLSIEEYVSKAGLKKIQEEEAGKIPPQVPGAPVEETTAPDMVSTSEDTLLASQKVDAKPITQYISAGIGAPTVKVETKVPEITYEEATKNIAEATSTTNEEVLNFFGEDYFDISNAGYVYESFSAGTGAPAAAQKRDIQGYFGETKYKEYQSYLQDPEGFFNSLPANVKNSFKNRLKSQKATSFYSRISEEERNVYKKVLTDAELVTKQFVDLNEKINFQEKNLNKKYSEDIQNIEYLKNEYESWEKENSKKLETYRELVNANYFTGNEEKAKEFQQKASELENQGKSIIDLYNQAVKNISNKGYEQDVNSFLNFQKQIQEQYDANKVLIENYNDISSTYKASKYNYDLKEKAVKRITSSLFNMVGNIGAATASALGYLSDVYNEKGAAETMFQISDAASEFARKQLVDFDEEFAPTIKIKDINNADDFGTWLGGSLADQALNIGVVLVGGAAMNALRTGGSALSAINTVQATTGGLLGLSSGSSQYSTMETAQKTAKEVLPELYNEREKLLQTEYDNVELNILNKKINDLEESKNATELQKLGTAVAFGLAETLGESFGTLSVFRRFQNVDARWFTGNAFKKSLILASKTAGATGIEGIEEAVTQVMQNGALISIAKKNDVSIFDGIDTDLFATTAATSLFLQGSNITSMAGSIMAETLTNKKEKEAINKKASRINELLLEKQEAKNKGDKFSTVKNKELNILFNDLAQRSGINYTKLQVLDKGTIKEIGKLAAEKRKLETALKNTQLSNLSVKERDKARKELTDKIKNVEYQKEFLLEDVFLKKYLGETYEKRIQEISTEIETKEQLENDLAIKHLNDNIVNSVIGEENYYAAETIEELEDKLSKLNDSQRKQVEDFFSFSYKEAPYAQYIKGVGILINQNKRNAHILNPNIESTAAIAASMQELAHWKFDNVFKKGGKLKNQLQSANIDILAYLELNKNNFTEEQYNYVKRRAELYKEDGVSQELLMEETLMAYADLIAAKKIDADVIETSYGLKDLVRNVANTFGSGMYMYSSVNTAEGLMKFIKDFSSRVAQKGISAKITDEEKQIESVKEKLLSKSQKELNDRVDNLVGKKDENGNYQWNSKEEFQSSEEFIDVYDKVINGNLIDPLITRGIEGDIVYGKPIERFIEDVKDGLTGTLMRFDPSKNNSLIGFINQQLAFRKGDVSNKYKKEFGEFGTTSIDIEAGEIGSLREIEAEDTNFDELIDQVQEEQKVLDTATVFGKEFAPKFKEEFETNVSNIDTQSINSFKDVPRLVTSTLAEIVGVNPSKITDPKKNLSSSEARSAQQVIFNISDKIMDILAKGAVTEAAAEDIIGTSTGMPKNLLKNFYEKDPQRRTEAQGLFEFRKRTDLTKEDVLAAFGMMPDGTAMPSFNARTPEAQTIKAFLSFLDKMISNSELRKMLAKNGGDLNKIQNIAAGKSEAVFSMSEVNNSAWEVYNDEQGVFNYTGLQGRISVKATDSNGVLTAEGTRVRLVLKDFIDYLKDSSENQLNAFKVISRALSHGNKTGYSLFDGNSDIASFFNNNTIGLKAEKGGTLNYGSNQKVYQRQNFYPSNKKVEKALKDAGLGEFNTLRTLYSDQSTVFKKEIIVFAQNFKTFLDKSNLNENKKLETIALLTLSMIRPSDGMFRLAADVTGFSPLVNESDTYVFDHRPPASMVAKVFVDYLKGNGVSLEILSQSINSMEGAFIPKSIHDEVVNKFDLKTGEKFKTTQQKGYVLGETDPFIVYDKKGVDVIRIKNIHGKTFSKSEAEAISDLESKFAAIISLKDPRITPGQQLDLATAKNLAATRKKRLDVITPGANDFDGLMYTLLAKGKLGEEQYESIKKNLYEPYSEAHYKLNNTRQSTAIRLKKIQKENKELFKKLKKDSGFGGFTFEQALRVWLFQKAGYTPSGINEDTQDILVKIVKKNKDIENLGKELSNILPMQEYWVEPDAETWQVDNIKTDVINAIEKVARKQFLDQWKNNVDQIFSKNNMNKLVAAFGEEYVEVLKDMLYRMETGSSRPEGSNKQMNVFMNWVRGSVATTMFFNRRSAVLQQISNVNFLNWGDNNPIAAAKAFANQKQYWEDFVFILNSDYLKERRGGLKTDINAAELAEAVKKKGFKGALGKLLQAGFSLTQLGDSLAIATGGSTFYRNRINTYTKQGLTKEQAEKQAFLDFQELSEETQQSARPDRLSQQQTTVLGRVFLSFQNTPMQMTRLSVKAGKDLLAGRGDPKEKVFKMLYYGAIQSIIFSLLQTALIGDMFGVFEDDEDDDYTELKAKKTKRVVNGVVDSFLKGTGVYGVTVATVKNALITLLEQEERKEKGKRPDYTYVLLQGLNISPPVGIKARNFYGALKNYEYNAKYVGAAGFNLNNPAVDIGSATIESLFNIPALSTVTTLRDINTAVTEDLEIASRLALLAGWHTWDLGLEDKKLDEIKAEIKKVNKQLRESKKPKRKVINL